jgi:hypothetical protein
VKQEAGWEFEVSVEDGEPIGSRTYYQIRQTTGFRIGGSILNSELGRHLPAWPSISMSALRIMTTGSWRLSWGEAV